MSCVTKMSKEMCIFYLSVCRECLKAVSSQWPQWQQNLRLWSGNSHWDRGAPFVRFSSDLSAPRCPPRGKTLPPLRCGLEMNHCDLILSPVYAAIPGQLVGLFWAQDVFGRQIKSVLCLVALALAKAILWGKWEPLCSFQRHISNFTKEVLMK